MSRTPEAIEATKLLFLGIGFAVVWAAIAAYLFSIARRQRALEKKLAEFDAEARAGVRAGLKTEKNGHGNAAPRADRNPAQPPGAPTGEDAL